MKTAVKLVLGALGVLLVVFITAGALLARKAHQSMNETRARLSADWATYAPDVVADTALWKDHPLFAPHDGGDASALLFAHVGWENGAWRDAGPPPPPRSPLPTELQKNLRAWGNDWPAYAGDAGVEGLDLAWFAELSAKGYWDLEPVGGPLDGVPFEGLSEPIPRLVDAMMWAKARLLQGLADGSHVKAGAEVRELARLCLTTELLIGEMVGVGLLGIERHGHAEAVRRGLDVTGWVPVTEADQERLKRLLWAAQAPLYLTAEGPLAQATLPVGRCTAVREGLGLAHFLRAYLEKDLPERYAALTTALEQGGCRLRRPRLAWTSKTTEGQLPVSARSLCTSELGAATPEACAMPDVPVTWVPFARTFIGSTVVSVANPDWFGKYRAP